VRELHLNEKHRSAHGASQRPIPRQIIGDKKLAGSALLFLVVADNFERARKARLRFGGPARDANSHPFGWQFDELNTRRGISIDIWKRLPLRRVGLIDREFHLLEPGLSILCGNLTIFIG
jgi:hypothetical protein